MLCESDGACTGESGAHVLGVVLSDHYLVGGALGIGLGEAVGRHGRHCNSEAVVRFRFRNWGSVNHTSTAPQVTGYRLIYRLT